MKEKREKQKIIITVFLIAGLILLAKTAQLQIFDSSFVDRARRATLDKEDIYPSRGLIYDRNEKLLVINEPVFELRATYNKIDPEMDTSFFCKLLEIDTNQFLERINKNWSSPRFHKSIPFVFMARLSPEIYGRFQEHEHSFPGFSSVIKKVRTYPYKNTAHALGYLGETTERDLRNNPEDYNLGDYIGKTGVERTFEENLRGEKGVKYLIKDNLGREVSSFEKGRLDSSAVAGQDLTLSIDIDLQAYGELLMQNKRGSVVAIEPSTGEILSMISAPIYNPDVFVLNSDRTKRYVELLSDTINKPFLDRSLTAKYPPGSIFKPVLSLIGLQEGAIWKNKSMTCNGYYQYKGFRYGCHDHPYPYNISVAIEHSCNAYFFQLVRDIIEIKGWTKPGEGLDIMNRHLKDFGMGAQLGLDHTNENKGFIPSSAYYDNLYKKEVNGWKSTYVMSIGIGQGELELTTVQMANLAAIIANRGKYYIPHIVKKISGGSISDRFLLEKKVRIDDKHFTPVIDGMERAINTGTGGYAAVPGIRICGKTGTSQNPHGKDHSVFFAFAPRENPKIAIAVYVENAGFGGSVAAPIAGLMIEKYLNKEIAGNRKWIEDNMVSKVLLEPIEKIEQ